MDKETRLKLAVQKSGRLTDPSLDLLARCGLKLSRGKDQLMGFGENMPLDVLFVRDDDIPDLVQEDVCDLGPGRPERARGAAPGTGGARRHGALRGPAHARLRPLPAVAGGARGHGLDGRRSLRGPAHRHHLPLHCWRDYLRERDIKAEIVTLSGAVEIAPRLGRADLICDLVSTGSTLQANHLREVAHRAREPGGADPHAGRAAASSRTSWVAATAAAHRRRGAGQGEQVHHAACAALGAAARSASCCPAASRRPSFRSRVRTDKVAVHAVCRENVFWETLESLKAAGASAVLVLPVEKMLA